MVELTYILSYEDLETDLLACVIHSPVDYVNKLNITENHICGASRPGGFYIMSVW